MIITVDVPRISPTAENDLCRGSWFPTRSDCDFAPLKVRDEKYETKSVSADIHVLQINLHRGSLSSINREQRSKAGPALAGASDS
ncbi:hypothetical protein [Bradyrhizobium cenepequi]